MSFELHLYHKKYKFLYLYSPYCYFILQQK
nr:MAG TPA: hypothetical protein [Caudoviricetes sp.]